MLHYRMRTSGPSDNQDGCHDRKVSKQKQMAMTATANSMHQGCKTRMLCLQTKSHTSIRGICRNMVIVEVAVSASAAVSAGCNAPQNVKQPLHQIMLRLQMSNHRDQRATWLSWSPNSSQTPHKGVKQTSLIPNQRDQTCRRCQ